MKALITTALVLVSLALACRHDDASSAGAPAGPPAAAAPGTCEPDGTQEVVTEPAAGNWQVESRACLAKRQSRAAATVAASARLEAGPVFHLARARAWATLSREFARSGRPDEAIDCLRRAVGEIGVRYATPEDARDDDTPGLLSEADTRLKEGRKGDAIATLTRALNSRLEMFTALNALR